MSESNNRMRLLWAGFMAILAAGVGFAIRGGIFDNWAKEYGFTGAQLGAIGGMGFSGFCFGIILGGVVVDKIGYRPLIITAFLLHIVSALITFTAGAGNAFTVLSLGMFVFAFANGTLEAVANPLVATLFPENRTHYLNILHASWPAGMVIGVVIGWFLDDKMNVPWKIQLALYLIPTVIYGLMFMGQSFPKSEAAAKGVSAEGMFKDVGILGGAVACALVAFFFKDNFLPLIGVPAGAAKLIGFAIGGGLLIAVGVVTKFSIGSILLFVLYITHALVGAVELGTDQWIQNITGNLFTPEQGKILFFWTSAIMFGLRFCAHFIESKLGLKPVGLLFVCAALASAGLFMASSMTSFAVALVALGVYAFGKTFFWPTMLAVASDRFPRTGAVAMSIMGGIGMLSAGILGSPFLGYSKDRFAGEALKNSNPALYEQYKAATPSTFLGLESTSATGLDGTKLAAAKEAKEKTPEQKAVVEADQAGDRATLKADAYIPLTMAVIYLLLALYFKSIGGYRPLTVEEQT